MFIIGIDPRKGSHTAAVIDGDEQLVGEFSLQADRRQRSRLLQFAEPFTPRMWAIEGAMGHGALLAQQLVASGETVVDVRRRCRHARGCWIRAARTRPTPVMRARLRLSHCGTGGCGRSRSRIIVRSCGSWRVGITCSPRQGLVRSVGCMPCSRRVSETIGATR